MIERNKRKKVLEFLYYHDKIIYPIYIYKYKGLMSITFIHMEV